MINHRANKDPGELSPFIKKFNVQRKKKLTRTHALLSAQNCNGILTLLKGTAVSSEYIDTICAMQNEKAANGSTIFSIGMFDNYPQIAKTSIYKYRNQDQMSPGLVIRNDYSHLRPFLTASNIK